MTRDEAKEAICREYERILQGMTGKAKRIKGAQSYICPLCGNGSGSDGDGIIRNPKSDSYGLKCFKCGFSGDIIRLYREHMGADYNTALSLLAQEIGIEIDPYKPDAAADQGSREQKAVQAPQSDYRPADDKNTMQTEKAPENGAQERTEGKADYTEYYRVCRERINSPEAASYLSARGISIKTAVAYWIGFDPAADMAKAPGGQGEIKFPCPRIIIPTSKSHYAGRSIDPNTPVQYQKMNVAGGSPGIFNRQALYAQKVQEVFITEGAFDALSIAEAGAAAVALNSTSNADAFIKQLEKEKPAATLIICLDNDEGGNIATKTIIEGLQRLDIPHITADICGQYKDPNEALTKDREGFIKSVKAAVVQAAARMQSGEETKAQEPADDIDIFLQSIQGDKYKPYPTGIKDIDNRLGGGLIKQWLILIGAEPGAGKTAFACQIMENYARQGQECIYYNLEMSKEQLLARSMCRIAYQSEKAELNALQVLRGYKHTERERDIINRAAITYKKEISPALIYNPDNIGTNIDAILKSMEDKAEAAEKAGKPAPFICLDYLQLVTGGEREDVISTLKRAVFGMKKYALKHHSIVVCIMAQSRAANSSGKATISAGRDTSNLEYTCDLQIQMIKNKIPGVIDFFITKSRFAAPDLENATPLLFKGAQSLFLLMEKMAGYKSASLYGNNSDDEFKPLKGNSPFDEDLPKPTKIV